jgi:hypothetical protein
VSSYLREALRLTVQYAAAGLTSVAAGLVYLLLRAGGAPPWFGTVVGVAGLVGALAIWHVSGKLLQPGDKSAEIAQAVSDAM